MTVTKPVCKFTCYDLSLFLSFPSELHRADIYWPYQPASLQCHQLQRGSGGGSSGGQQLQQLSDICQQPGSGLQHCHQADLRPHESDSQVQPSSLLTVPCCCKAHLSWRGQPAGEIHCRHVMIKVAGFWMNKKYFHDFSANCFLKWSLKHCICLEKKVFIIW